MLPDHGSRFDDENAADHGEKQFLFAANPDHSNQSADGEWWAWSAWDSRAEQRGHQSGRERTRDEAIEAAKQAVRNLEARP